MAVAREELDVLVYPDLGMESLTYFMAYARLAPVQVREPSSQDVHRARLLRSRHRVTRRRSRGRLRFCCSPP